MKRKCCYCEVVVNSLIVGDWVKFEYGSETFEWYVLFKDKFGERLVLGTPKWLIRDGLIMTYEELEKENPMYLGRGKKKWWFCNALGVPFTRPK